MFSRRGGNEMARNGSSPSLAATSSAGAGAATITSSVAHTITSTIADGVTHTIAHWRVIILGQGVALILAIAGGTNEMLSFECKVNAPSTYNALGYALICILGGVMLRRENANDRMGDNNPDDEAMLEEQESFRNQADEGCDDKHDDDDDDDELTLDDDDSPRKRISIISAKLRGLKSSNRSQAGSESKSKKILRPQYPFLCGMFTIHAKWYYYFAVAFIEAQAYYLIFLAFRYTTFSFVYVSDALAIPSAILFTRLIMRKRYSWTHLIGCFICIAGIVVNTVSDMSIDDGLEHVSSVEHIKGDILAITGAILLGLDDVLSEIIVSDFGGVTEMLFMKGLFGALISIVQMGIFERKEVYALFGSGATSSCNIGWRMALLASHSVTRALDVWGEMQFLFVSEAALLNLLLLTSDLYAAIFDVVTVGMHLTPYFYGAFFLILCGIVLYEAGPSPAERQPTATPIAIEFRQRGQKPEMNFTSSTITELAGNPARDYELT